MLRLAAVAVVALVLWRAWPLAPDPVATGDAGGRAAQSRSVGGELPPEARLTLELIERGGPYPYDRDGSVFQNRERRLPAAPAGYYREYTVDTPGSTDRGARRIVTGGNPPEVYYYTDDHYRTFRSFEVPP